MGIVALALTFVFGGVVAQAQQPAKVPRIGYLTVASLSSNVARVEAFRHGLRELGYVEGKNIVIEWRSAEGKFERQGDLAAELVRLKVDVIVTSGPTHLSYLPPYQPGLNMQERVWRQVRYEATTNRWFDELDTIWSTVQKTTHSWSREKIRRLCNTT